MEQHVINLLSNSLSSDHASRTKAEATLAELGQHSDYALTLSSILASQDYYISLRQSAGFVLKKYVREHWSIAFETFTGQAPESNVKETVRSMVFSGLSDGNRKIRLASANLVSEIASSDWPDEWPELLNSLVRLMASGQPESVHGAMRVMKDFVSSDLSEDQLLPLSSAILPQLLHILTSEGTYSAVTRSQSVLVFRQCLSTLYMVKENFPQAAQYATQQVLPQWIETFNQILSKPTSSGADWSNVLVKNAIFQTLTTILVCFPKSLSANLPSSILQAVQHLTEIAPIFRATCLNDELSSEFALETEDTDTLSIPQYAANIFEFVAAGSRKTSGKAALVSPSSNQPTEVFVQVIYLAIFFGQITTDDEETWESDMEAYVADEDDEIPAATVRTATLDLTTGFMNSKATLTIAALMPAMNKILVESEDSQRNNELDWWKGLESCLMHLSSVAEELGDHLDSSREKGVPSTFSLDLVFNKLVIPYLENKRLPYLQGRALIFASRFTTQLPSNIQQQFFEGSIQAFESQDDSFVVKICALRALKNFCQEVPDSPEFAKLGTRITTNLLPFVSQAQSATLILILETLQKLLPLGTIQQDMQLSESLTRALLVPIVNNSLNDPLLSATLSDLYRKLASSTSPVIYECLKNVTLPQLAILASQEETDDTRQQVISSIVIINAIFDGRPSPMGEGLFTNLAASLFTALSRTEDDSILQEGLESITFVIRKDVDQLLQWQSATGESGLSALFNVIARVLQPDRSEAGGLFVGDLLLHVFRRAGQQILPILPDLLKALVVRLSTALTATFSQSLILPFAYLMHSQVEVVLELLEGIDVEGKSGIDVLMTKWCDLVESFQGFWSIRVSTVAFGQLLLTNRPSLNDLLVKGDLIVTAANSRGIVTRSRSKKNPDQYTQIPCRAKILKVLLKELEQSAEPLAVDDDDAVEDGGEGEDWEDDEEAMKGAKDLSHFINGDDAAFFDDDDDEISAGDEDLKNDPVYNLDLPGHLSDTIRTFASSDKAYFDACIQYLTAPELHTLRSV